jgi:hypothetical protein
MQIYAELHSIDYTKLLEFARARLKKKTMKIPRIAGFAAGALNSRLAQPLIHGTIRSTVRRWLTANDIGIDFAALKIDGRVLLHTKKGEPNMFNFSTSVDIDYSKLVAALSELQTKGKGLPLDKILEIVKPFIGETMKTIPPSAIAELFELVAKDIVVEKATDFGVKISAISLKTGVAKS